MTKIFLKEVIETGAFGPVKIGSTKQDVIDFFGENYDFGDFGDTQIIKYGWWEFFYWTESQEIFAFQNDHLSTSHIHYEDVVVLQSDKVEMDNWFISPDKHITFETVTEILRESGIEFRLDKYSPEDPFDILRLSNDITIDFDNTISERKIDPKTGEYDWECKTLDNSSDFILNGIKLFKY